MSTTITFADNPQLLKLVKELAKALDVPLTIKKSKDENDFHNSPEFLAAVAEASELKEAYLRGEIDGIKSMAEYEKAARTE